MKRSLTEAEAMLLKAARGAGVPLGHAEDFARAGRLLLATQPEQAAALLDALDGPHVPAALSPDQAFIADARAVMAGPLAIDLLGCGQDKITLQAVDSLAVLSAMLALAAGERAVSVTIVADGADVILRQAAAVSVISPTLGPVDIPHAIWDALAALATRTFVPATEASRVAGAGAGLTDND